MDVRICTNGHQVPQEDLKACPACGASLLDAEVREVDTVPEPTPTASPRPADDPLPAVPPGLAMVPAGLIILVPGIVLGLLGWLIVAGADGRGIAAGGGILVLWLAGILSSIGVIAIGVRIGINDTRS
ncbi:hypothetical protein ncot_06020 [Nocardioides sp. JQ2195]|uniref:hypothetical protein n=1 Tax=Nocardioides sp. JQ2195 TaxID=2592334 RepID=UPI00143E2D7D|nr:hypothetical protein [Nocardioides sp. JQ2195]QIX26208.1 hypothetical protein ncot_06020 [Nocardioides sp. JQ2195]